jgi:hypothetical protein
VKDVITQGRASRGPVAKIEHTLQQLANVIVLTARQDERIIAIERRVDRLEQIGLATVTQRAVTFSGCCLHRGQVTL